jgi:MOSC domain-containing protein YiiM
MQLISVNVGKPKTVQWHGREITSAIFKKPLLGRVTARKLNIDGDQQADLNVHGGVDKAVYCYSGSHYDYWRGELHDRELPWGTFGENFTYEGQLEDSIHVGDTFSVGSAEFVVTQPRLPCYKLGMRFEADDMVKRFLASGRTGYYLAVIREGEVGAGDAVTMTGEDRNRIPIAEVTRLYVTKQYDESDTASVNRMLEVRALPESWKAHFRERLEQSSK